MTEAGHMFDPTISIVHMRCPRCGPVELRPSALHVTVFLGARAHRATFFCPGCTEEVTDCLSIEASDFLVDKLGVGWSSHQVPEEFLEEKSGPAISPDDVLDFVLALRGIQPRFDLLELARERPIARR